MATLEDQKVEDLKHYEVLFETGTFVHCTAYMAHNDHHGIQEGMKQARRFGSFNWIVKRYTGIPGKWTAIASNSELDITETPEIRNGSYVYHNEDGQEVFMNIP